MRVELRRASQACLLVTLGVGCTKAPPPVPDPKLKHEAVYRSQRRIEGAIAVGVTYMRLGELLQDLSTELLVTTDKASGQADQDLIALYRDCLHAYSDSVLLWKHKIDSEKYDWMKGAVYQGVELLPLVQKYKLPTERRPVPYTKQEWTAITADPVQIVWASASTTCSTARNRYLTLGASPQPGSPPAAHASESPSPSAVAPVKPAE